MEIHQHESIGAQPKRGCQINVWFFFRKVHEDERVVQEKEGTVTICNEYTHYKELQIANIDLTIKWKTQVSFLFD